MSKSREQNEQNKFAKMSELEQLADDLLEILAQQKKVYREIREVAEAKQETLVENEIEELSEIVGREEELTGEINSLEDKRSDISERIAELLGKDEMNISLLRQYVSGERESSLAALQAELTELLEDVSRLNEQNRQLLLDAMKFNEFSLKLIMQGAEGDSTYSADGKTVKKNDQQARNIIDRQA